MSISYYCQAAKTVWAQKFIAYVGKRYNNTKSLCKAQWLIPEPLGGPNNELSRILEAYLQKPFCSEQGRVKAGSIDHSIFLDLLPDMEIFTQTLIPPAPGVISNLPPCLWETVEITHASSRLYGFGPENSDKLRLVVRFEEEMEVNADIWAYGLLTMLNNAFGYVGLYLGIGVLEVVLILEKILGRFVKY